MRGRQRSEKQKKNLKKRKGNEIVNSIKIET